MPSVLHQPKFLVRLRNIRLKENPSISWCFSEKKNHSGGHSPPCFFVSPQVRVPEKMSHTTWWSETSWEFLLGFKKFKTKFVGPFWEDETRSWTTLQGVGGLQFTAAMKSDLLEMHLNQTEQSQMERRIFPQTKISWDLWKSWGVFFYRKSKNHWLTPKVLGNSGVIRSQLLDVNSSQVFKGAQLLMFGEIP